ncbi:hypothetical protein [Burkholderia lata]|uniref:hypothetical protein n=1 Tax=Burkholderia lata (strain ATCC 17760 / DSM 23089 / LMG 22485 / NCIMB 9086 / R18194 / 383) TaxID=482957 RepID=UPI001583D265|nr:hypothetical protein [Burkholderia lata]
MSRTSDRTGTAIHPFALSPPASVTGIEQIALPNASLDATLAPVSFTTGFRAHDR